MEHKPEPAGMRMSLWTMVIVMRPELSLWSLSLLNLILIRAHFQSHVLSCMFQRQLDNPELYIYCIKSSGETHSECQVEKLGTRGQELHLSQLLQFLFVSINQKAIE